MGTAAWMLDHDARSYDLIARVFNGVPEGLTRDDVLDNITFYWFTNTAVSSARLYWESAQTSKGGFFDIRGLTIPVSVTVLRAWSEKYKNQGLVVIGVHTPEFPFETNIDNVRRAMKAM